MAEERQSNKISTSNLEISGGFKVSWIELAKQSEPSIFSLFELPFQKNTQFTGREEQLSQISDYLLKQNTLAIINSVNTVSAQAIAGLGGVGKSQLAIEYAYQAYEKKSYQIIWFMNGQNLDTDYLRLAAQLKVYGENKDDIIERTRRKLEGLGNYLLIIDDAEDHETIKSYLPQTGNNGHVLITTRHRLDWQKMLELGVFTLGEALEYFKKITNFQEKEKEDVIKLIDKLLGLLPLALTQAGAFIKQTGISVKEYIEFFETKRKELWGVEDKARDYTQTITVTWDITINRIQKKYPQAEILLQSMSYLAPTPNKIDQNWLSELVIDEQERISTLEELAVYSMIEKHQKSNNFLIHALVQEVIFENAASNLDQIQNSQQWILLAVLSVLNKEYEKEVYPLEDEMRRRSIFSHMEIIIKRYHAIVANNVSNNYWTIQQLELINNAKSNSKEIKIINNTDNELAKLNHSLGYFYYFFGKIIKAKIYLQEAIIFSKKINDREIHMTCLIILGTIYRDQLDYDKSLFCYETGLDIASQFDNKFKANFYSKLGTVCRFRQDPRKAVEWHKKALEIYEINLNFDQSTKNKLSKADCLHRLGDAYHDLADYDLAIKCQTEAYQILFDIYGVNHREIAANIDSRGKSYLKRLGEGDEERALKDFELARSVWIATLSEEHPKLCVVYQHMGDLYFQKKEYAKAAENYKKAYEIGVKTYGENHFGVTNHRSHWGRALCKINGKYKEGIEHIETARKLFQTGNKNRFLAINLVYLGEAYAERGEIELGLRNIKEGYEILMSFANYENNYWTVEAKQILEAFQQKNQANKKQMEQSVSIPTPSF